MRKQQQEREDCVNAVYRNWCAVWVKVRCVEKHLPVEPLEEEGRQRTKSSLAAFDHVSVTGKRRQVPNSDSSKRRTDSNGSYVG